MKNKVILNLLLTYLFSLVAQEIKRVIIMEIKLFLEMSECHVIKK